jgi:hypothetical protein
MVYEESGAFVTTHPNGGWLVYRPSKSGTHSEIDSAYVAGVDGLSVAICRALYIARGPQRGLAAESMRLASDYMSKARKHGRNARAALAAFDAGFML